MMLSILPSNVIWPALYIAENLLKFWFLIIMTIVVEMFVLKYALGYSYLKSFVASLIGNLVSGLVGTFLMAFGMLGWHFIFDSILFDSSFNLVNWVASYVLMCLGSVAIETLVIKLIYKEKFKTLFKPLLIGNMLTYIIIAAINIFDAKPATSDPKVSFLEQTTYIPLKQEFQLLDSTQIHLADEAEFKVLEYRLNDSLYNKKILFIPFQGEKENYTRFHFEPLGKNDKAFGFPKENIEITLNDTPSDSIVLQLRQKMPNSYKWTQQPTDTLVLIKK
ncbi:hypothetical protein [Ornithobacterium rhinotracheale]|uniref:hypothetical protein n=1 Tax=Ornithobacterium rhinotracheale TaxID=28251 RepID=UPI0040351C0B